VSFCRNSHAPGLHTEAPLLFADCSQARAWWPPQCPVGYGQWHAADKIDVAAGILGSLMAGNGHCRPPCTHGCLLSIVMGGGFGLIFPFDIFLLIYPRS
jgi:hypothetical protein